MKKKREKGREGGREGRTLTMTDNSRGPGGPSKLKVERMRARKRRSWSSGTTTLREGGGGGREGGRERWSERARDEAW